MDREDANRRAYQITFILNKRISTANSDPLMQGAISPPLRTDNHLAKGHWIAPECNSACKNCNWPTYPHQYQWPATFEWGMSDSSSLCSIQYIPLPMGKIPTAIPGLPIVPEFYEQQMRSWQEHCSTFDATRELYSFTSTVSIASHKLEHVLVGMDGLIDTIRASRRQ